MSVIKYKQDGNFTQISNIPLRDKKLRMAEKGLLTYLFSKPKGWDFAASRIALEAKDAEDTIRKMLIILEKADYLIRKKLPNGKVDYYLFYDKNSCIQYKKDHFVAVHPNEKPILEKAMLAKSHVGKKQGISNTYNSINTEKEINIEHPKKEKILNGFEIESFFRKLVLHSTKNFAKLNNELDILEVYRKHGEKKLLELMSLAEQAPDRWEGTEYTDSVLKRFIDHLSGNLKLDKPKPKTLLIDYQAGDTITTKENKKYTIREVSNAGLVFVEEDYNLVLSRNEFEVTND